MCAVLRDLWVVKTVTGRILLSAETVMLNLPPSIRAPTNSDAVTPPLGRRDPHLNAAPTNSDAVPPHLDTAPTNSDTVLPNLRIA